MSRRAAAGACYPPVPSAPQRAEIGPCIFGLGLLPAQVPSTHQTSPEKRLLLAALVDGIGRLQRALHFRTHPQLRAATPARYVSREQREYLDEVAWFNDPTEELLSPYLDDDGKVKLRVSFRGLCDELGLDAAVLVRGMRAKGWLPPKAEGGAGGTARMAGPWGDAEGGQRRYRRMTAGHGRGRPLGGA